MREYFNIWTPKFYKVNISNPKSLLEELQNYINITEWSNYIQPDHIKYLIEEYLYYSWKDIVYKIFNKNYKEFNNFLRDNISIKSNVSNMKQNDFIYFIDELKNRINPIIRNLEKNYYNKCIEYLSGILIKDDNAIKAWDFTTIKKICYSFSTEILRKGYSKYYIYENIQKFLFWKNIDELNFIKLFNDNIEEYKIYTKIITKNWDIKKIFQNNFWKENIFIDEFPFYINDNFDKTDWESKSFWRFFAKNNENQNNFWLKLNQKAIDYITASNIVINKINILLDEVKFEYVFDKIDIFHYVISDDRNWNKNFTRISNSLNIHKKNSSVDYFNSKNEQIKGIYNSKVINNSTKEKLKTIFRFYRYFLESNTLEHKFLNLWIWWEHIFSLNFNKESQTWKNIQLYYPFIDSIFLFEDILKDMIQVQFNRNRNKNKIELDLLLSKDLKFIATNLYKIIKEKWDKWDKLLNCDFLRENDLTKVKLFRLHEKFKTPKKFVRNNKNKVKWNLYRLYRVRNAIVHKWNIESLWLPIEMLISDLENYYTNLLDFILNRFSTNDRFENIEQLFISVQKTYDFFQNEKGLSKIIDTSEIKKRIINLHLLF